ncbi:MAG: efflux RND transporter periplasmic adaptor subunit [Candidatus Levybacteria bacterium]|nr:efflux RND transporter periplasmic adaptor subunit [Candidatus Levybacteria bacterium]
MKNVRKFLSRKRFVVIGGLFLLVVIYWIFQNAFPKTQTPTYQIQKAEKTTLVSTVTASGQIVVSNRINVTTQASGIVKDIFVSDGQVINAGDKILEITLDSQGQQASTKAWSSYLLAKTSLDTAQANINSLQSKLFKANQAFVNGKGTKDPVTDDPIYIQQRADWLQAEADYKNQQAVIGQTQAAVASNWQAYQLISNIVTAPISGAVGDFLYAPGMSVNGTTTAQKVATIQTGGNIIAQFNLSELDVVKVHAGQKATVTLDAFSGKEFSGKVLGVDKTGVIATGVTNYPVTVQLDTAFSQILANMAASVVITINEKPGVVVVPSSAVQERDGKTVVRVLKDKKIVFIPVVTGATSDTETEIVRGLKEGDEVITGVVNTQRTGASSQSPFNVQPRGFGGGTRR